MGRGQPLALSIENRLWYVLRARGLDGHRFNRQVPIGPYFADFVCREQALILEIDGGQHNDTVDAQRTAFLNAQGYDVLRFWNSDVLHNRDGVLEAIRLTLAGAPSPDWRFAPADLSPTGRGTRGQRAARASHAARLKSPERATPLPLPDGERSVVQQPIEGPAPTPHPHSQTTTRPAHVPLPLGERSVAQQPGEGSSAR